jgi:hypothetical protein
MQPDPFQSSPEQPNPQYPDASSQSGFEKRAGYGPPPPPSPLYPNLGDAGMPTPGYEPSPRQGYGSPPPWKGATPPVATPPRTIALPLMVGIASVAVLLLIGILIYASISQGVAAHHAQATETAVAKANKATQIAFAATATQGARNGQATATAAAQATNTAAGATYTAAIPGANCDTRGGAWADGSVGTYQCLSNGLQIGFNAGQGSISTEFYQGNNGTFPTNYSLSVNVIAGNLGANGCAGVEIRFHDSRGGFGFLLCPSQGFWRLESFDGSTGAATTIDQNSLGVQYQYGITATANGDTQTYSVDGTQVTTYTSGSFSYNNEVGLVVDQLGGNSNGSAIFSNFSITTM